MRRNSYLHHMEENSKKLVEESEVAKVVRLGKMGLPGLTRSIMDIMKLSRINDIYSKLGNQKGLDFIDGLLEELEVGFEFFEDEINRIPKTGPFVVVSNHPLGGIDGIILIRLISQVRPDFKVMANYLLQKIEPMKGYFVPVNPFEERKDVRSSFAGIKESMQFVNEGHGLGIFPAGEVSTYNFEEGKIVDRPWQESAIKLIEKMEVPVVPLYFKARNSRMFYFLAAMSPVLRTAKLPSEVLKQKGKSIQIRIGKPIPASEYKMPTTEETTKFLRNRTYLLASPLKKETRLLRINDNRPAPPEEPIMAALPPELLTAEVEAIKESRGPLTSMRNFHIYLAQAKEIPNLLLEIGRLREITFREVGEGTGKPQDLDAYDHHYQHLFLWDSDANRLVGAYRLGIGADIYKNFGIKGFYVPTLFKADKDLHYLFEKSLEMGRAFVVKDYQQKPMPLFLLWKGITHVILRNPDKVRYLIGCVSISNKFSKFSKSLMVEFVKRHYYDPEVAQHIKPKRPFKSKLTANERELLDSLSADDLNKIDKFIDELEPGGMRFPVLLKKYIKQNAKIVGFNVDPDFNNSVDGLMYIDINDLPDQTIKPVMEELEEAAKKAIK